MDSVSASPRIERVETLVLDIPTIRPHRLSVATMHAQTLVLVRIHSSDGVVGTGEGTTIGGMSYGPESPEGIKLTIDTYIAPQLVGADPRAVRPLMAKLAKTVKGNHFAKCAVETALLDAHARRLDVPMSELFGGRMHDRLPVAWTLASGDTAKDIAEAEAMLDARRHNVFKLKIGLRSVAEDVAHVAAIKRAVGDRASVRVDVNMAWSERDAHHGLPALADAGCDLVEQPTRTMASLARLTGRYPIAVMADESVQDPDTAFLLAQARAADVFAVKTEQAGGLFAAQRVGAIADAAGIELYGGTMLEGGIGTASAVQVFSTFARLQWGTEFFGPLLLTEEILATPLQYRDFHVSVPTGPGLGVELDEERVQFFRRDVQRNASVAITAPTGA
ncbi:muconate/chloromuconate family cycloisomerase [Aerolutibacter ruishenii]|uniref:Muconate cycloisomerase n=1 Tax=Aerolutibacter ruishenii TaxID=686800 RepID=A0A562LVL2_9GAMM|nr:muconate/chloromuconate family cycloisomerase [Lysobacter ruishenii]TWI11636.1 muconate cycloisomerase [Lysobacter ruishenii]